MTKEELLQIHMLDQAEILRLRREIELLVRESENRRKMEKTEKRPYIKTCEKCRIMKKAMENLKEEQK